MCYDKRYEDNDGEDRCDKDPTEHLFETTAGYLFTLTALDIVGCPNLELLDSPI